MKAILEFKDEHLPVSVEYLKNYFAIEESDEFVKNLLQVAIEHIELQNGISLRKKTWKVINDNNYICLNFPPIIKLLSITDADENEIKPISIKRCNEMLIIQLEPMNTMAHIRYEAGYTEKTLPNCLRHTICEKFWELYLETSSSSNEYEYDYAMKNDSEAMYEKYAIKF